MTTEYQKLLEEFKKLKCKKCSGLGTWDDADCNDIMSNTYLCKECSGTGINYEAFKSTALFWGKETTDNKDSDWEDSMGGQFTKEELNRPDRL